MKKYYQKIKDYSERHPYIAVFLFFTLLTFLFTYPLGFHFNSQLPSGGGDTYQALSNIDSRIRILADMDFVSGVKFFLEGIGTYSPYVLLNLFLNKYAAYNTMFFLSYILSGLGAYLLAYHLTKRRGASLVAGIVFAFSPFHHYQTVAVHLGSMQQQWIPFAALFFLKFLDDLKFKNYVLFLLFLCLLAISEHQLMAFSILFLVVLSAIRIFQNKELLKNKKLWIYLGASAIFFAIIAFFVFGDLFKVVLSGDNFLDPGSGAAKKYAMKPWEPLLPPSFHALWPGVNEWLRKTAMIAADWRDSYFISFAALVLAGTFLWKVFRKKSLSVQQGPEKKNLNLWLWTFLVMYIFSWGPGIKIAGWDAPLPYYLVYKFLPFYENIRVTGRLFMFAMLALAMLVAYAIKYLQPMMKENFWKKNFVPILAIIIMLEFWVAPIQTMSLAYSPFYDRIAKEESYKILEIPGSTDYEFASYKLFTNNVHGKKSVDGMALARSVDGQFNWQRTTPVVKSLLYTLAKGNNPEKAGFEVIKENYFALGTDILNYNNIRYITINKKYLDTDSVSMARIFVEKYLLIADKYEDDFLLAYGIARKEPIGFYSKINSGSEQWSIDIKNDVVMAKKMGDGASMTIMNLGQEKISISVRILAQAAGAAKFYVAGKEFLLSGEKQEFSLETEVAPGENMLEFTVKDKDGNTIKIDPRKKKKEGVLVYEIEVRENK